MNAETKQKESKPCLQCGLLFYKPVTTSKRLWKERTKFCSKECMNKNKKGKPAWNKGLPMTWGSHQFPKGNIPWNKGKKYPQVTGEKNNKWKGNAVGNNALHAWVKRQLGNPQKCEKCGTDKPRIYDWSNKSGKYLRDISDWQRLCRPCHRMYDYYIMPNL